MQLLARDGDRIGGVIATVPLISSGESVGVLEVAGAAEAISPRLETLQAVADQLATVVRTAREQSRLEAGASRLARSVRLSQELLRARTKRAAVRNATRLLAALAGAPAAGWVASEAPTLELVAAYGVRARARPRLSDEMDSIAGWDELPPEQREELMDRFADIVGARTVSPVRATGALVLIGDAMSADAVQQLMEERLQYLAAVQRIEEIRSGLDLGLALTAHEVRGPLLGMTAALDSLLGQDGRADAEIDLLRRSRSELQELTDLMEHLLRWSVRGEPVVTERYDLVPLVRRCIGALTREIGEDRVALRAPDHANAMLDPKHFEVALNNLLRNAIAYSPRGSTITVSIRARARWAVVSVSDRGPGLSPQERAVVFQPLVRGTVGRSIRGGRGLGLYIARRVVEEQGGQVNVHGDRRGVTFRIQLPAASPVTPGVAIR